MTGRAGYGFETWLPYIKGGFAAGNVETGIRNNAVGVISQGSAVHAGWTVGGGVEVKHLLWLIADGTPLSDPLKLYVRAIGDGRLLTAEEERFSETLSRGMRLFDEVEVTEGGK